MPKFWANTKLQNSGSVQAVLLIIIVLIIGGLVGGALVYLAASRNIGPSSTTSIVKYPPGTVLPTFAPVVDVIKPAVVNVNTEQNVKSPSGGFHQFDQNPFDDFLGGDILKRFFGQPQRNYKMRSLGSGVIVDPEGYILTNNHVVEQADVINITLTDGTEYKATVVGKDPKTDIALLKINGKVKLPIAILGDSESSKVGDWVLAIGNPFGYSESVSHGIISAFGRHIGVAEYEDFIQTDAAINPGNSGGPLVNLKGEVIGINTVIATQTGNNVGIGFAIPSNLVKTVFAELKAHGKVVRGWLGIGLQDLTADLAKKLQVESGVRISGVIEGSPAEKAGIQIDDIITKYDGQAIKNAEELRRLVGQTKVGKTVQIEIIRKKQSMTVKVIVGEMPADTSRLKPRNSQVDLGLTVENISAQMAKRLKLDKTGGVLVTGVEPDSMGESAGIQQNDIILEINDHSTRNVEEYDAAVTKLQKGSKIYVRVYRDGYILYLSFNME